MGVRTLMRAATRLGVRRGRATLIRAAAIALVVTAGSPPVASAQWSLFAGGTQQDEALRVVATVGVQFAQRHGADAVLRKPRVLAALNCANTTAGCGAVGEPELAQLRDAFLQAAGGHVAPMNVDSGWVTLDPPQRHGGSDSVMVAVYASAPHLRPSQQIMEVYYLLPSHHGEWVVARVREFAIN